MTEEKRHQLVVTKKDLEAIRYVMGYAKIKDVPLELCKPAHKVMRECQNLLDKIFKEQDAELTATTTKETA